jgi:hypothetical protein
MSYEPKPLKTACKEWPSVRPQVKGGMAAPFPAVQPREVEAEPSAERAPVPTPVARFDLGEVQVNTVCREPGGFVQQFADLLRELSIHVIGQPANTADKRYYASGRTLTRLLQREKHCH